MKKLFLIVTVAAAAFAAVSCGNPAKLSKGKKVELVFNDDKYRTDNQFFRESQSGVSKDLANAKKIAIQNARQEMATNLTATVQRVIENYSSTYGGAMGVSDANQIKDLAYTIVNTQLSGVRIIGEEAVQMEDGSYRYHVCLEMAKEDVMKAIEEKMLDENKADFEQEKAAFRELFKEKISEVK